MLNRKNEIRPFEDVSSLEFLLDKNDCALFAVGTHNKKRPLNLIMVRRRVAVAEGQRDVRRVVRLRKLTITPPSHPQGRTYDKHVLDMVEFGVSSVAPLDMFKGVEKKRLGAKPCIVFAGEGWEHDATLQRVRSLFIGASCVGAP